MSRRRILVAVGAAVAAAVALVLLISDGDESAVEAPPTTVGTSTTKTETPSTGTAGSRTPSAPQKTAPPQETTPPEVLTNGPRRDVARAITSLIQAVELGDGNAFCRAVGRSPGDADGVEALRACGRQAKIDPFGLPTSDELSVTTVDVRGSRAAARLGGGETVTLVREDGRWEVRSFARKVR